jgi:hypothetical protein
MKVIKLIAVIATLGFMPVASYAMSLTFDFTGGPTIATSRSFTVDGVTLDVTAQRVDTNADIYVSQNLNAGIGACTTLTDCGRNLNTDSPQLDSDGVDEVLSFAITGGSIVLDGFLFGAYNINNRDRDNFILTVDGVDITGGAFNPGANPWSVFADFGSVVATSSFSIRAISGVSNISSFRITELYATKLPEPGTLGMLLFGLAAVGLIRRRKSS